MNSSYWSRQSLSRRSVLRGAGFGVAGLAGAALIGCGGGDDDAGSTGSTGNGGIAGAQLTATAITATADANATPVPADQVRVAPGLYDGPVGPSAAELNPSVNAKYGGFARMRYLDPPHMDLAQTLSCTIYNTMSHTSNKLTRGKVGPLADPYRADIEADLAESWEVSEDGQKHTFNLRKGVKFHNKAPVNGREFTAQDVVKTVELYQGGSQKDVFSMVTGVETPDDYTVVFNLNQPLADFPISLAAWSYILPAELVDDDAMRRQVSVGTGPFIQDEWIQKEKSVVVRNPDYFEEGLPYLDGVELFVQSDTNAGRAGFATDNYHDYQARDGQDLAALFDENKDTMIGQTFPRSRGANVNGFQFQMKNPTFQDDRVRRAMSLAFDRNEYDLARNGGDGQNPEGPYSTSPMPWPYLYDSFPTGAANGQWYQFNNAEASKMMQAAGFTSDNRLVAELPSYYFRTEFAQLIVPGINQALPEVDITFREIDNPTHVTIMSDRNFDGLVGFVWGPPGYSMDQWIYPFYHSEGSLNYGSINDPDLDDLLVKQRAETNPDAQKDLWLQISDRIHDMVYQAWFPEPFIRPAWHNYLLNYRQHGLIGTYQCYASDMSRILWLDEGAPGR